MSSSPAKRSREEAAEPQGGSKRVGPKPSEVLDFLKICGKLKQTARTGWVKRDVAKFESVADHSWRMGVLPLLLQEHEGLDHVRCMKIGLVHDLAEAIVGDITPHCGVTKEEKARREGEAMEVIRASLPGSVVGEEIVALWNEYEAGATAEALVMKDLDKFEMCLQAEDYEAAQGIDLSDFFESTKGKIKNPTVLSWDVELRETRRVRRENGKNGSNEKGSNEKGSSDADEAPNGSNGPKEES